MLSTTDDDRPMIHILAPSVTAAQRWVQTRPFGQYERPETLFVPCEPDQVAVIPPGGLYAPAPGVIDRPEWPQIVEALAARDARHA